MTALDRFASRPAERRDVNAPAELYEPPLRGRFTVFSEAFIAAASQFANREAYVEDGRRLTFGGWAQDAFALAAAFQKAGVGKGDVVAIWLSSSIDFAICVAGVSLIGAIPTGVNPRLGAIEVAAIRDRARPRAWIAEDDLSLADPAGKELWFSRSSLAGLIATNRGVAPALAEAEAGDPALIVWTSGTTGAPKGAWFDHRCLQAAVGLAGPMTRAFDRRIAPPVFAHAGYLAKIWEQCAFGMALIIAPTPWNAAAALQLIARERAVSAAAVPTQWEKLVEQYDLRPADLSTLRICIAAAAPLPPQLTARMKSIFGADVLIRYAMTECPTIAGTSPGDPVEHLATTVGRALPGVDLEIRDEAGRRLPVGKTGRIFVKAPCMMRGYWNAPAETASAFAGDGWLLTGDLGTIDAEGRLSLAGRTTEMFIRGGYNIYPSEVERALSGHSGISQIAVVGIAAPKIGEIGVAFVVPADPAAPPTLEELRAWCRDRIADYKLPDRLELLDRLPLTAMMKVDKVAIKRAFQREK